MEHERAYVFQPEASHSSKRRRIETPQGLQGSWKTRRQAYRDTWHQQRKRIDDILDGLNLTTVEDIFTFLNDAIGEDSDRIPTGIILTGPASNATITSLLARRKDTSDVRRVFAELSASSGANLKALLKTLIQKATSRHIEDDDDEVIQPSKVKAAKLLSYDLQLLADYVREHRTQQVVVAFEDTEAFDNDLQSELIELLGCWRDRIPFVCLFSVATSVDFLQQRLSKAAIKYLNGRLFDVAPAGEVLEQVFEAVTDEESRVWIGPALAGMALERQTDYIQGIDSFIDAVQYAYMSHFYANALSVFLAPGLLPADVSSDHFEALRSLDSFRAWAQERLENGEVERLKDMLESDELLFGLVRKEVSDGRRQMGDITFALEVLRLLQESLPNTPVSKRSSLYVQAMSGKLNGSALVRSLLLTTRKQPSDIALKIMLSVSNLVDGGKYGLQSSAGLAAELSELLDGQKDSGQPLRSEDDVKNSTLRTTVIAQKVELNKQKSALSKEDAAYTSLLRRFTDMLETFISQAFINPKDLPFHEIFLYDLKSPYKEVFTPRPRHAIERALALPHDYLDCDCCAPEKGDTDEATLSGTQPATAVLYQLYLESGNLINANDLWQAFQAVMGEDADAEQTMALFQRALAELGALGMVKSTRKRIDHVAKVAWRGL